MAGEWPYPAISLSNLAGHQLWEGVVYLAWHLQSCHTVCYYPTWPMGLWPIIPTRTIHVSLPCVTFFLLLIQRTKWTNINGDGEEEEHKYCTNCTFSSTFLKAIVAYFNIWRHHGSFIWLNWYGFWYNVKKWTPTTLTAMLFLRGIVALLTWGTE